jgi:hypothetical protein
MTTNGVCAVNVSRAGNCIVGALLRTLEGAIELGSMTAL